MAKKEKATVAANPQPFGGKDSKNICIRATIKALFRSGKKFTARKINQLTHSTMHGSRLVSLGVKAGTFKM